VVPKEESERRRTRQVLGYLKVFLIPNNIPACREGQSREEALNSKEKPKKRTVDNSCEHP